MAEGKPSFRIEQNDLPPMKGPYFVLVDSEGNDVMESNVFDDKLICEEGAQEELHNWIKAGKIS